MAVKGRIFDIQRYSVHDGPGIRTTVFLQGCPLSCPWCHNPESRPSDPVPAFRADRCLNCEACAEVCQNDVKPNADTPWPAVCERCGRCVTVCPAGARELAGREVETGALLDEIERDRLHFEESGGGVTFSGGEPLAQPAFLGELLRGCRERELHTTVDTSGHAPALVVGSVADLVDLWLFDLKHPDRESHRALTGVDNGLILKNLGQLAGEGREIWLRVPLIATYNDDLATLQRTGALARDLGLSRIHLLPYHAASEAKRERFAIAGEDSALTAPTPASLDAIAARLRDLGLEVIIGG